MKTSRPDMPMLRAYRLGEVSAQTAINRAEYADEALEIIRASNFRAQLSETHPNAPRYGQD